VNFLDASEQEIKEMSIFTNIGRREISANSIIYLLLKGVYIKKI